jgi:hypothetical protein
LTEKGLVKDAPNIDPDGELSPEEERRRASGDASGRHRCSSRRRGRSGARAAHISTGSSPRVSVRARLARPDPRAVPDTPV